MIDYSEDYLEGKYGAIPEIKNIIDWDEVWAQIEKEKESQSDID